jgi:hypothetical protein
VVFVLNLKIENKNNINVLFDIELLVSLKKEHMKVIANLKTNRLTVILAVNYKLSLLKWKITVFECINYNTMHL